MVKSEGDVILSATNFVSERLCPIFHESSEREPSLAGDCNLALACLATTIHLCHFR